MQLKSQATCLPVEGELLPTYPHPITPSEVSFPTVLDAFRALSPVRSDSRSQLLMLRLLRLRFSTPTSTQKLLQTGDAQLVYVCPTDERWGTGRLGTGRNLYGQLLMRVREEVRSQVADCWLVALEQPRHPLTDWESNFVRDLRILRQQDRFLSVAQFQVLDRIYADRTAT